MSSIYIYIYSTYIVHIKYGYIFISIKLVVTPVDMAFNNVSSICKRFYSTALLKEFGVLHLVKHLVTHKLASDYNENILINSTVNEIKQSFFNICSRKYEVPSKTILYIKNAKITHFGEGFP